METKEYTQFGTFMVVSMLSLLLLFTVIFFKTGLLSGEELLIPFSVLIVIMLCLLLFYKISIYLNHTSLSFKMGIGLFGKSYKLSEIKSCKPVRNSVFLGLGIHILKNGWIYNVSGLKAIELEFYNKSSVVRIGTDHPEEICEVIQGLIEKPNPDRMGNAEKKKKIPAQMIGIALIILIFVAFIYSSNQETKVNADNNGIIIKGIYGLTVPFTEVMQIDTVSSLPGISLRTNGYAFGMTKTGNFRLTDKRQVKLFIKAGHPPYILINSRDRVPIYLNFEDKQKTINLYKELKDKI